MNDGFPGILLDPSLPGGQAAATVVVGAEGLQARGAVGRDAALRWSGMRIARGGASGAMLFCRGDADSPAIACEAPGFAAALRASAGPALADAFAVLDAAATRQRRRSRAAWSAVLLTLAALAALVPVGWRLALDGAVAAVPASVEHELGDHAWAEFAADDVGAQLPRAQAAVEAIVARLRAAVGPDAPAFTPRVLTGDEVNAFALPGGRIGVYRALLARAENPDQVAGVLAHEIAHVQRRHGIRRLVHGAGIALVVQAAFGDVSGLSAVLVQGGSALALSSHSRDQEREADRDGVALLARAGFDPRGMAGFFRVLPAEERGGSTPSWLSSHPELAERIADCERLAAEAKSAGAPADAPPIDWPAVRAEIAP